MSNLHILTKPNRAVCRVHCIYVKHQKVGWPLCYIILFDFSYWYCLLADSHISYNVKHM